MKKLLPLVIIFTVALSSLACSFTIQVPETKTGPDTTTEINEAYPDTGVTTELSIEMGGGSLTIGEGSGKLVEGQITTNVPTWNPEVIRSDEKVTLTQSSADKSLTIPSGKLKNEWDLKLGTKEPIALEIKAGAYKSDITFGSVPLTDLSIEDGASQTRIVFNKPNSQVMDTFIYHTGASQVSLINLGNANFKEMVFESGAGSYTLDFSGQLKQDATVDIESGLSNMKIIVPAETNAVISLSGGVNNVSLKGTWTVDSNEYKTQSSNGPRLEININMGVGNLELISQKSNTL
ncbi:MAG: hypothetical protein GYA12_09970 [Chloroflexi bacterium]|jgi:hypothetical protein|nr:hypothetical protein [Chloroflexota bacterium]BCY19235.1 hypothetical protein hrd7_30840 [Leptolinea sp. HRD-7]